MIGNSNGPNDHRHGSLRDTGQICHDLTLQAKQGKFDYLRGRKTEILELARKLGSKRKNSVMLIGDEGIGKKSIVKSFAKKITLPGCPELLKNRQVIHLTPDTLARITGNAEEAEHCIDQILQEAKADDTAILFIDDIHMAMEAILYAESQSGPESVEKPDLLRLLTEISTRRNIQSIVTICTDCYHRIYTDYSDSLKTFKKLWIQEPDPTDTYGMISEEIKKSGHELGVVINRKTIKAAVNLSVRYLPETRLPGKAMELLMQACSHCKNDILARSDILAVLSRQTGISSNLLNAGIMERLNNLGRYLEDRVPKQNNAIKLIEQAIRRGFMDSSRDIKPVSTLIFSGSADSAKAEASSAISECMFGTPENLISIDLAEYTDSHRITELLGNSGARPQYPEKPFANPGLLITRAQQKPAAVILFDNFEKAHPTVSRIILQLLDNGYLIDAQGKKNDFSEKVIIFSTSIQPVMKQKEQLSELLDAEWLERIQDIIFFESAEVELDDIPTICCQYPEVATPSQPDSTLPAKSGHDADKSSEIATPSGPDSASPEDNQPVKSGKTASREVALMVLDMVQSTHIVQDGGDTSFSFLINQLSEEFRNHDSSSSLLFLKCTGDGFLAVYQSAACALTTSCYMLEFVKKLDVPARVALHWGRVKIGVGGDPLGVEVHRVFRMEGLNNEDCTEAEGPDISLPSSDRILCSPEILEKLESEKSELSCLSRFRLAGFFRLKGFEEPSEIWAYCRENH